MKRLLVLLSFLALVALMAPAANANHANGLCPFCSDNKGPTLVGDFGQAAFVVVGSFTNAKIDAKAGLDGGTTDLVIEKTLKDHDYLKGKKVLTLPKYLPDPKNKYIVFCDVYKDTLDPYKGVVLMPEGDLLSYLTKAMELKDAKPAERLRHCFDYLQSGEIDVSMDAYREFAKADYDDYKDMAKKLPADKIASWLEDPKTPPYRLGLYASLIGHCGDPAKHGKLLRSMIDDAEKRNGSGLDGLLAAYAMLQKNQAWTYIREVLAEPEKQDFDLRYAALRTLRFFYDTRMDVLTKDQVVQGVTQILAHKDMADFAIDDLRKWKRWEKTDDVLDLAKKESHSVPVVNRAILRFALQCPEKRAKDYVAQQRQRDPAYVRDAEELLRFETPAEEPPAKK